jgi:hypothetical protein
MVLIHPARRPAGDLPRISIHACTVYVCTVHVRLASLQLLYTYLPVICVSFCGTLGAALAYGYLIPAARLEVIISSRCIPFRCLDPPLAQQGDGPVDWCLSCMTTQMPE